MLEVKNNTKFYIVLSHPRHYLFLLCMLLIGSDLISISFGGLTFRLVAFFIFITWVMDILQRKGNVTIGRDVFFSSAFLCISAVISIPFSFDLPRTLAYTAWLLFTFFILVPVFFRFSYEMPILKVLKVWFLIYRIQIYLLLIELLIRLTGLAGEFERPHLWFYEPSYAAIYFAAYIGAAMYLVANKVNWAKKDLIWAIVGFAVLSSATGFYAILFAIFFNTLYSKYKVRFFVSSLLVGGSFMLVLQMFFSDSQLYKLLIGYMLETESNKSISPNLFMAILERGGNRLSRMLWGWDTFIEHPWVGIGFGADKTYTETMPIGATAELFFKPWDNIRGGPFINPFIEAASTMGIPGFIGLLILFSSCIFLLRSIKVNNMLDAFYVKAIMVGFLIALLTLQFESTFLRFYLWSNFGLAFGAVARWRHIVKVKSITI